MSCGAVRRLDLLGYGESWIHRRDSRAKLLAALVFLISVASFPKYEVSALMPFFLVPVIWSRAGAVPFGLMTGVILTVAPFAVLLGAFNPLLDRSPMLPIGEITLSGGWISFSSIILRFVLSVGISLTLVGTTSMPRIFNALLQIKIPRVFVLQLEFLYRHLFVLVDEATDLSNARSLRDPGHRLPSISLVSKLLSTLLYRSIERAQRVYMCMQARGFRGEVPVLYRESLSLNDYLFVSSVAFYCLVARLFPLTQWIGTGFQRGLGY